MSTRDGYKPGEFGWVDLSTPDLEAGIGFYRELMGWDHELPEGSEEAGGYGFFTYGGKRIAGAAPTMSDDQPPAWASYVRVADADETAAKVKDAGGNLDFGPIDLPAGAGRMGIFQDPQGAFCAFFEPGTNTGAELVNEVPAWTWNNLLTPDLDGAKRFYGDVFGWTLASHPDAPENAEFMNWQLEGQRFEEGIAGATEIGGTVPEGTPPHWQVYFCVESAQGAIDKTKELGGQALFGPQETPNGPFAFLMDPQGAAFCIIEPQYPDPR